MGQYLINFPDIPDIDLVFDKSETREILSFFYPSSRTAITALEIMNDARRLAQTMLFAAVDASYSMSFVDALANSLRFSPKQSVRKWVGKLSGALARKWFKHATQKDLMRAEIYGTVRSSVAWACAQHFNALLQGVALRSPVRRTTAMV